MISAMQVRASIFAIVVVTGTLLCPVDRASGHSDVQTPANCGVVHHSEGVQGWEESHVSPNGQFLQVHTRNNVHWEHCLAQHKNYVDWWNGADWLTGSGNMAIGPGIHREYTTAGKTGT